MQFGCLLDGLSSPYGICFAGEEINVGTDIHVAVCGISLVARVVVMVG